MNGTQAVIINIRLKIKNGFCSIFYNKKISNDNKEYREYWPRRKAHTL